MFLLLWFQDRRDDEISSNCIFFFSFSSFGSQKVNGNVNSVFWLTLPSVQSRVNFCVKTVFQMPATPFVITVLTGWSLPGGACLHIWLLFLMWLVCYMLFESLWQSLLPSPVPSSVDLCRSGAIFTKLPKAKSSSMAELETNSNPHVMFLVQE